MNSKVSASESGYMVIAAAVMQNRGRGVLIVQGREIDPLPRASLVAVCQQTTGALLGGSRCKPPFENH